MEDGARALMDSLTFQDTGMLPGRRHKRECTRKTVFPAECGVVCARDFIVVTRHRADA